MIEDLRDGEFLVHGAGFIGEGLVFSLMSSCGSIEKGIAIGYRKDFREPYASGVISFEDFEEIYKRAKKLRGAGGGE